jgi:hypothetical protein
MSSNAAGARLIDQAMLNTILVLVVVTSLLGPIMTEWLLRRLPASGGPVTKTVNAPGPALPQVEPARRTPA